MNRRVVVCMIFLGLLTAVWGQNRTMQIAGVTRSYIVHAPNGVTNPPLVFNIHGYNMDAASEQSYTRMDQIADREKFIVVYPNAINKSWDLSGPNDYAFILAIIDTIDAKYHIDRNRIYACGFSQGGFMSFQLACRYSDIFAAIAPTSGTVSGTCNLKRPVPMRLTFGTNEFDRGATQTAQFMQSVMFWVRLLHCPETPQVTRPYPPSNPNSLVTRLYYGPCDGGSEVVADSIRTGGHEWPMNTNDRINNSEETWAFLKKFSLKNTSSLTGYGLSLTSEGVFATYACGMIHFRGAEGSFGMRIFDTKGRVVAAASSVRGSFPFSGKTGGVYVLVINEKKGPATTKILIE